ncbi:MAG: fumarylacetoacetate hydrolase family protein, partial [Rhodospirillales bacterium]
LEGKLHLPLLSSLNGKLFGKPQAGVDMTFSFPKLISHAAKTRPLGAGTIIGSGTVSNKQDTSHGSAIEDGGVGYSCIAELRMYETISKGKPVTPFMQFGDTVRIEMLDADGMSVFGAIDQKVVRYRG